MKKAIGILIGMIIAFHFYAIGQPQWKYHIAFKDGTGASDTVWFVYDENATYNGTNDISLGEIPVTLNLDEFNVYMNNPSLTYIDTFKLIAIPWEYAFEFYVHAFNFQLPLTISWDTSLLHSSVIPPDPVGWMNHARLYNDYFFMINNHPSAHEFDMTVTNFVQAPEPDNLDPWFWEPGVHFPMDVYLSQNPATLINSKDLNNTTLISPNPVRNILYIQSEFKNHEISVFSNNGRQILRLKNCDRKVRLDVSYFEPGVYIIGILDKNNTRQFMKFLKVN